MASLTALHANRLPSSDGAYSLDAVRPEIQTDDPARHLPPLTTPPLKDHCPQPLRDERGQLHTIEPIRHHRQPSLHIAAPLGLAVDKKQLGR